VLVYFRFFLLSTGLFFDYFKNQGLLNKQTEQRENKERKEEDYRENSSLQFNQVLPCRDIPRVHLSDLVIHRHLSSSSSDRFR